LTKSHENWVKYKGEETRDLGVLAKYNVYYPLYNNTVKINDNTE